MTSMTCTAGATLTRVLRDVDIDIILLLHPLQIVLLSPQPGGPHVRRAEVDYEVDRTVLPTGEIRLGEVRIEFSDSSQS